MSEEEAPFAFGELEVGGDALPVRRVDIHARVTGVHAHVTLEQTYVNDRSGLLEVIYVFPMPALGAVSSYAFTVDGVTTRGTLHEREQARAIYDRAIAAGQAASTLEEDRPEVMTVRVGNLPPGSTASVQIGMDLILPITDDRAVLRLPLLVGARYVPGRPLAGPTSGDGTARDTDAAPDASRITPPRVDDPGTRVGVVIDAFGAVDVLGTHPLEIERQPDRLRVRIADTLPDGDIVLQFPLRATDTAVYCPDADGPGGTLIVTACCALPPSTLPLDVAVLLDRSGSMEGDKLALARRAAIGIMESLTPRDRLLAIAFDHEVQAPLGAELIPARATQRRRAIDALAAISVRGGTEIAEPLQLAKTAFARAKERTARRAIVLITDGQVANEDQLVAIAARSRVELLTVAIGAAANQGLCKRLASVTGGTCESAESSELVAGALDRTLRRLLSPALDELELVIEGATVEPETRTPRRAPRAIPGVPATIASRVIGVPTSVELRAIDHHGKPVRRTLPVETVDLPALRRVWARLRLRDLEDEITTSVFPTGLALEDALVAMSLEYGVLSRYTAFVAVDKTLRDRELTRERIVQPVIATERKMEERQSKTRSGTLYGKIVYLSPEQAKGLPVAASADVFTLGMLIFELAALKPLFRADSDMATLMMILQDPARPLPEAYAVLQPILDRALAKDPAARYRDAGELLAALAALPADRRELAEIAAMYDKPFTVPGPLRARSRAWWLSAKRGEGYADSIYEATYAGSLDDALPDVLIRVPHEYYPKRDPLVIDHPNIARVLGVLAYPEHARVIEYLPGLDLHMLCREITRAKSQLSLGQVVALAQDLASALAAIHAAGVVHGGLGLDSFRLTTKGLGILTSHAPAKAGAELPVSPLPVRGLGALIA